MIKIFKGKKVRLVDGFKIRNFLDPNFNEIPYQHSTRIVKYFPKYYIPKNEIWLDSAYKNELEFLLNREGLFIPDTLKTDAAVRRYYAEKLCLKGPVPDFKISKSKKGGAYLVIVDGTVVRRYIDPEFVAGGHHYVYKYVPKNEIWVEKAISAKERPYVYLHEKLERDLMKKGRSYDYAHEIAIAEERDAKRKAGLAAYPGDAKYPFYGDSNDQIIKRFYVD
jgi:hypothetical protein